MKKIDINSLESLESDRRIIQKKKLLHSVYVDFYKKIKKSGLQKPIIEVGSGAGFVKSIIPDVTTTDVIKSSGIDKKAFAEKLPFKKSSIGSIIMLNVFHHIKRPDLALKEFERCLKPGGKIVMIEPWVTPFSKFIYQNFHHENFDTNSGWKIKGKGRMSDANGALPWIIFERDKNKFEKMYSNFILTSVEPHTPLKYLVSGGLSKPQLAPNFLSKTIHLIENILSPLNNYIAMFVTIEIIKK